jgi:hypothetical protein
MIAVDSDSGDRTASTTAVFQDGQTTPAADQ